MCRQFDSGPRHHHFWLVDAKNEAPTTDGRGLIHCADANRDANAAYDAADDANRGSGSASTGNSSV